MPLNGNLETVSLAGILQLLCDENKTGICSVSRDGLAYQIYLLEGSIVYAIRSGRESRLGALLLADGRITETQLKGCIQTASRRKQALGKTLVDQGLLSEADVKEYIYLQVQEIVATLFQWDRGEFSYKDTPLNLNWLVIVQLNTTQLIMDGLRNFDEIRASG